MGESRKKKTYEIPQAVPVIFRVTDIVVTSTGEHTGGDIVENSGNLMNQAEQGVDKIFPYNY